MFLEGEVNWVLVLGLVAVASVLIALFCMFGAARAGLRLHAANQTLAEASRKAETADRRLFQILNAIPVALVETDAGGKFVFANRAAHQLLGRRDAELIGLRFHSATWGITYPDGRPIPPDLLPSARALRGQTVKGFQHLMANPSNRKRMLVAVTAMPVMNERDEVIGSTAAIVETETLTQPEVIEVPAVVEPALAGPDFTRRVFEAASSALVVVGADGRVLEVNRTALDLDGRPVESILGADFADTFLGEDARVEGRQALRAALSAEPGSAEPIVARGADGSGVLWRILPLAQGEGEEAAILLAGERYEETVAATDADEYPGAVEPRVTIETDAASNAEADRLAVLESERDALRADLDQSRAEAEAARAAAAAADEAARAELEAARRLETVGRLTGGVAHDFSALLSVMTSALDMLLKQADEPDRVRRLGAAALAAGQRGEALTRRLSAFSQGEDAPAAHVLDLGVLLRGMESSLRARVGANADLLVETPSEPVLAQVDPVGFEGVVRALLENAIEASPPEGASVAVRVENTGEGPRLTMRDSGVGMSPDIIARATEPFFTTRDGAAGLGLSQVYAFVRQSRARLNIDSAPDRGAEVAITLPGVDGDDADRAT
jgi:signal transduction histidine kinase